MKTTFVKTGLCVMMAVAMLTSCKKGDPTYATASSSAQLSMGVKADNTVTSLAANASGQAVNSTSSVASNITFTSAIANISGFKFEAKRKGLQIEVKSHGLTTVDLFAISPSMTGISLDTGTYAEIEIKVQFTKSNTTALPLVAKGNFTTSTGTVIPFEFDLNDNAEIKAEAHNVVVDGKANLVNIITLHLNKLLAGVSAADVAAATQTLSLIHI